MIDIVETVSNRLGSWATYIDLEKPRLWSNQARNEQKKSGIVSSVRVK